MIALIPVNHLDQAKGRLAAILSPAEREALAIVTAATVVGAARDAGLEVVVLTPDPRVAAALPAGLRVLRERDAIQGLNAQLEAAIAGIEADELLILHADLPLVTGRGVRSLLEVAFKPPSVTVVESADGGTNAMLLRPPGQFSLAYGPGSAAEHRKRALAAGVLPLTFGEPSLRLDLDTPSDLRKLLGSGEGRATPAGRLLVEWGIEMRLGPPAQQPPAG